MCIRDRVVAIRVAREDALQQRQLILAQRAPWQDQRLALSPQQDQAVSYTHLDVYKRQGHRRIALFGKRGHVGQEVQPLFRHNAQNLHLIRIGGYLRGCLLYTSPPSSGSARWNTTIAIWSIMSNRIWVKRNLHKLHRQTCGSSTTL